MILIIFIIIVKIELGRLNIIGLMVYPLLIKESNKYFKILRKNLENLI